MNPLESFTDFRLIPQATRSPDLKVVMEQGELSKKDQPKQSKEIRADLIKKLIGKSNISSFQLILDQKTKKANPLSQSLASPLPKKGLLPHHEKPQKLPAIQARKAEQMKPRQTFSIGLPNIDTPQGLAGLKGRFIHKVKEQKNQSTFDVTSPRQEDIVVCGTIPINKGTKEQLVADEREFLRKKQPNQGFVFSSKSSMRPYETVTSRQHWGHLPEEYQTFTSPLPKQKYVKHADLSERKKKSIEADGFSIMRQSFLRKSNEPSIMDTHDRQVDSIIATKREKKYSPRFQREERRTPTKSIQKAKERLIVDEMLNSSNQVPPPLRLEQSDLQPIEESFGTPSGWNQEEPEGLEKLLDPNSEQFGTVKIGSQGKRFGKQRYMEQEQFLKAYNLPSQLTRKKLFYSNTKSRYKNDPDMRRGIPPSTNPMNLHAKFKLIKPDEFKPLDVLNTPKAVKSKKKGKPRKKDDDVPYNTAKVHLTCTNCGLRLPSANQLRQIQSPTGFHWQSKAFSPSLSETGGDLYCRCDSLSKTQSKLAKFSLQQFSGKPVKEFKMKQTIEFSPSQLRPFKPSMFSSSPGQSKNKKSARVFIDLSQPPPAELPEARNESTYYLSKEAPLPVTQSSPKEINKINSQSLEESSWQPTAQMAIKQTNVMSSLDSLFKSKKLGKSSTVKPNIGKKAFAHPKDVVLIKRGKKRTKPKHLLVVQFEGVLATFTSNWVVSAHEQGKTENDDGDEESSSDSVEFHEQSSQSEESQEEEDLSDEDEEPTRQVHIESLEEPDSPKSNRGALAHNSALGAKEEKERGMVVARSSVRKKAQSALKKAKKKKPKREAPVAVVFEESTQIPEEEQKRRVPPEHAFYFRHGIPKTMGKLKKRFHIAIIISKQCGSKRQKQIVNSLKKQNIYFDSLYQYRSDLAIDTPGPFSKTSRFFSIDQILSDSGYTPASSIFLTSVDCPSEKQLQKPGLPQYGLMPLPYTIRKKGSAVDEDEGIILEFHKLVVMSMPHALSNAESGSLKTISFSHIYFILKNFCTLCEQFEKTHEINLKGQDDNYYSEEEYDSEYDSEEEELTQEKRGRDQTYENKNNGLSLRRAAFEHKAKYVFTYDSSSLRKRQIKPIQVQKISSGVNLSEGEVKNGDHTYRSEEYLDTSLEDKTSGPPKKTRKEPKFFYRGFKKAKEHGLFSLAYLDYPEMALTALKEKLDYYKHEFRKKIMKIEGLALRLQKLREKQAFEEKETAAVPLNLQKQQMKEKTWNYESMRKQPAYVSQASYVKQYYREIYEECTLTGAKIYWPMNQKEGINQVINNSQSSYQNLLAQPVQTINNVHPTLAQLKKLRSIYMSEIEEIDNLLRQCSTCFVKSYNLMQLQGQLYKAKELVKFGLASQFTFKAKLIVGGVGSQQKKYPNELNSDEDDDANHSPAHSSGGQSIAETGRAVPPMVQMMNMFNAIYQNSRGTFQKNQIPVEQVDSLVNWISKKVPGYQVQYQQV